MSKILQNAPREHSAILSTFIKLQFVFTTFVLSNFEWPLKTGFTVIISFNAVITNMMVSLTDFFCQVWSESLPCAQWVTKDPNFLHEDSKDCDQTELMPRLI